MNTLMKKSLIGAANLNIFYCLLVFIAAGTIHYPQAWIFLAVFDILTLLVTLYLYAYDRSLLEGRLKAGAWDETRKTQKIIQTVTSLLLVALLISAGVDYRYSWSEMGTGMLTLGNTLVIIGYYIIFLTFRVNAYTRWTIEVTPDQKLVTTGPYSHVRHPMYSGGILIFIGAALALWSYIATAFSLLIIALMYLRCRDEESLLQKELPGYTAYMQKVTSRMIPFIL